MIVECCQCILFHFYSFSWPLSSIDISLLMYHIEFVCLCMIGTLMSENIWCSERCKTKKIEQSTSNTVIMMIIIIIFIHLVVTIWPGISPWACRTHILVNRFSNPVAYCLQSNNGLSTRAFHTLCRMLRMNSRSLPRRMAIDSYSCRLRAINSGQPRVLSWEAATL